MLNKIPRILNIETSSFVSSREGYALVENQEKTV